MDDPVLVMQLVPQFVRCDFERAFSIVLLLCLVTVSSQISLLILVYISTKTIKSNKLFQEVYLN